MIRISNHYISAEFSTIGAQLTRLSDGTHEYLWSGNPDFWRFQAPSLFPIVGRLKNDQYTFNGNTYKMHQHGFARESEFKLIKLDEQQVTFGLADNAQTTQNYPFKFKLTVTYTLNKETIMVNYQVMNPGSDELLFSIGAHPAFNMPLDNRSDFDRVKLQVSQATKFERIKLVGPYSDIKHPEQIDLTNPLTIKRSLFDNDAIILNLHRQPVKMRLINTGGHGVEIKLTNAPYVGVWSPFPKNAPFICIEPWWGIADSVDSTGNFSQKMGINRLSSHEQFDAGYSIKLI